MRMASSSRVTPRAVISPVSTGWPNEVCTKRLRGQVVDLVGPVRAQHLDQRDLVEQVAGHEGDPVLEVADALEVDGAGAPHHADHLVALVQQELGQVGAVLAGDAGDERTCSHGDRSTLSRPPPSAKWVGTCATTSAIVESLGRRIAAHRAKLGSPSRSWPTGWPSRGWRCPTSSRALRSRVSARWPCWPACSRSSPTSWWPARLPGGQGRAAAVVVARHTEVELRLALLDRDLSWLDRLDRGAGRGRAGAGRLDRAARLPGRRVLRAGERTPWRPPAAGSATAPPGCAAEPSDSGRSRPRPAARLRLRQTPRRSRQLGEQVGQRLVEGDLAAPSPVALCTLAGSPRSTGISTGRCRVGSSSRRMGCRAMPHQALGQLADGQVVARADVVGLARLAVHHQQAVGPAPRRARR